ncbi:Vps51/Vps67 vacuolar sorting complex protein [Nitzschia inconspicua]|uniref:Vps51/Vps67 vacuolar sorting complex protein n=1 Tax=Nitzschia inconspicua TaxID=303405 RepID=A0A9K3PKI0_9STRA|nr:Vps51/Vps67 vacuolar sorting complex protein [Nitzschia inconspicua]
MSAPNSDDGDADSFSSDSEDEFLTMRDDGKGGNVDREALIRKKLLESFYGKAAVTEQDGHKGSEDSDDDDDSSSSNNNNKKNSKGRKLSSRSTSRDTYDDEDSDDEVDSQRRGRRADPIAAADLDSPDFDAAKHTEAYVLHSGVHPLLETEESLACQVRTLDSSMQTLVYENYSRFIEATDAIRSIGVNVQANSSNLQKLSSSMESVGETARNIENSCGALRDSVVEKLRVKRLLQRLDALLKLPSTLRENINAGRYRWASKSYLTAYNILSKHSAGFESLQRIEIECYEIMEALLVDVRRKLLHWSGNFIFDNDQDADETLQENEDATPNFNHPEDPPDPPKSVVEIFECAGAVALMLTNQRHRSDLVDSNEPVSLDRPVSVTRMASRVEFETGLTMDQCKNMALSACLRLFERFLDSHHIELQEAMFATDEADGLVGFGEKMPLGDAAQLTMPTLQSSQALMEASAPSSSNLIPTKVLDSILEAATLYSMTFHSDNVEVSEPLSRFVSTSFETLMQNVKSELLDQLLQAAPKDWKRGYGSSVMDSKGGSDDANAETTGDIAEDHIDSDEKAYQHITNATSLLVESVRQLASGLSLPEVAIDVDIASVLVEQALGLSEAMVRKRVDQKFFNLRFRVIKNCLAPFCRKAIQVPESPAEDNCQVGGNDPVADAVQLASVALSDSLQLVDDTIRSILSHSKHGDAHDNTSSFTSNEDASMLKVAVQESSNRFANWLASAMEALAGCESIEHGHLVDIKPENPTPECAGYSYRETPGEDENTELVGSVEGLMDELLEELESIGFPSSRSDLSLAIVEMCRLAQSSVFDDIATSIATHTGIMTKPRTGKAGLFATSFDGTAKDHSNPISDRFRLAASRVLNLYSTSQGNQGASLLCASLVGVSQEDIENEERPHPNTCALLELIKSTCIECSGLFGGSKCGGPVPENLEDEYASLTMSKQHQLRAGGLASDVERMFAEKVVVYPNSFEYAEFDRNSVVFLVMKVAVKGLLENCRSVRFSVPGYRNFLVDMEFLKFLLPHYVKNETLPDGSNPRTILENMLSDICMCAKERCDGSATLQDSSTEINWARAAVRDFMSNKSNDDPLLGRFLIVEEDGTVAT